MELCLAIFFASYCNTGQPDVTRLSFGELLNMKTICINSNNEARTFA